MKITPIKAGLALLALLLVAAIGETARDVQTLDGAQRGRLATIIAAGSGSGGGSSATSSIVVTNLATATGNGAAWTEIAHITTTATNGTALVEAWAGSETTSIGYLKIKSDDGTTLEQSAGPWNPGGTGLRMHTSASCAISGVTVFRLYVKQDAGSVVYTNVVGATTTVSSNMLRMVVHQFP